MGFLSKLFGKKEPAHEYATEYEKAKAIYGSELEEVIKYWSLFYILKEKGRMLEDDSILRGARVGLMQKLEHDKGKAMLDKVMKFGTVIDEDKFAKEIDIINAVENDTTGKYRWD